MNLERESAVREMAVKEVLRQVARSDYSEKRWQLMSPKQQETRVNNLLEVMLKVFDMGELLEMSTQQLKAEAEIYMAYAADTDRTPPKGE